MEHRLHHVRTLQGTHPLSGECHTSLSNPKAMYDECFLALPSTDTRQPGTPGHDGGHSGATSRPLQQRDKESQVLLARATGLGSGESRRQICQRNMPKTEGVFVFPERVARKLAQTERRLAWVGSVASTAGQCGA